jgi:putative flippase GtrA
MKTTKQFTKYGSVAIGSAFTDYLIFTLLLFSSFGTLPSQMFARFGGGLFSFFINKYWSFSAKAPHSVIVESRRFTLLYIFSYFLALGILYLLVEKIGLGVYLSKIIADITSFIINFIVMRQYVFSGNTGIIHLIKTATSDFRKSP